MARSPRTGVAALAVFLALASASGCEEVKARRDIQEGNKAYYEGRYDKAVVHYQAALARRPDLTIGWYNLGLAHLALIAPGAKTPENERQVEGAIKALDAYLARVPTDTQARDYLLSTYIDSGHYEGALKYFEDKLAKNPRDVQAVAQLAQINMQALNYDEANRWHRKRVEIEASSEAKADAWYSIGVLNWRRLHYGPEIQGAERARIADEGLAALKQADLLRPEHVATVTYVNLLYRQRSAAHDASVARVIDLVTAQTHYKRALALAKARAEREAAAAAAGGGQAGGEPAPGPR